jgi:CMP-N-acetylneuraminic acid synthetase
MEILGIIPARGGSKSVPLKSIRKIGGKPLIAWAIESAKNSNINRVIVTTDDERIAKIAKRYGAEVPYLRPKTLARDKSAIEPVIAHALTWLEKNENYKPDALALLLPTSPLRNKHHLNEAIEIFKKNKPDSVVSVHEAIANNNPSWMLKKNKQGKVVLSTNEPLKKIKNRRQELPKCYIRNDIIYLLKPKNIFSKIPNLYGGKTELFIVDEYYDADINTEHDWLIAVHKFRNLKKYKQ